MQVRALDTGYYEHKRRREGDLFDLRDEKDFSEKWMEAVDGAPVTKPVVKEEPTEEVVAEEQPQVPTSGRKGRKSREVI